MRWLGANGAVSCFDLIAHWPKSLEQIDPLNIIIDIQDEDDEASLVASLVI